ncbi:hypothetical protein Chor_011976 [Crotalus horridus]
MIPVAEFKHFTDQQPAFKVLKPWWDVLAEYLTIVMLMIGVFGCTLQVIHDKIICLPNHVPSGTALTDLTCEDFTKKTVNNSEPIKSSVHQKMSGLQNNLDLQQYSYINQMCYETALHWYAKYFPYLVIIHTLMFMVCASFWFKFPGTSSKIEHFISIMSKCFDSPWTTRTISEVSEEENTSSEKVNRSKKSNVPSELIELSPTGGSVTRKKVAESPSSRMLGKKEGEEAKALFEKVKKFRLHVEKGDILYTMYIRQTVLKVCKFLVIIVYNAVLVHNIKFIVPCSVKMEDMTGYDHFCCNHTKAYLFAKLAICFLAFLGVYGMTCLYTLYWLFHRPLKEYSFRFAREDTGIKDIPDVKNDFAFMLHLIDQYDSLYSKRFAIFLSEDSEFKLKQLNLNHEWTHDKLQQKLQTNPSGRLELHLFMLPGLPDTTFELIELEALKLELLQDVTFPASVTQLINLQELMLINCPAKLSFTSLKFFREQLKVMMVNFDDIKDIPVWIYNLRGLEELYISGFFNQEMGRTGTLETLRELKNLKILTLHSNISKLPPSVADLATHLQKLRIHNDGTKLVALNNLKKLFSLQELKLINCNLERIPHAIFSLVNLQELDLKNNKLVSIEEVISFQHCRKLICLKLWHNQIFTIPEHIRKLKTLEQLDLSHNYIEALPSQLFMCTRLHYLDLSYNKIQTIPSGLGVLQSLQYFAVSHNCLETLPNEIYFCKKLKVLKAEHNKLRRISDRISWLPLLSRIELKGNQLEALPLEIGQCKFLKRSGLMVESNLYETLPLEAITDKGEKIWERVPTWIEEQIACRKDWLPAVMFALSEVTFFNDSLAQFQSLKPWWDVLMDYLVLAMLMISVLSGTLLISVDNMTCLPLNHKLNETSAVVPKTQAMDQTISEELPVASSHRSINLDYQQYLYISYVCYQKVLPWFLKYFPYFALVNSLFLMASNNFWFRYPKTSSKIEHFLSILTKCFESPWTTKALSEIGCQHFLGARTNTVNMQYLGQLKSPSSPILDAKDRELGQALFEKIRRFRAHTEGGRMIYRIYLGQTFLKIAKVLTVLGYTFNCIGSISFKHVCLADIQNLIGYSTFICTHSMAFILQKLIATYIFLVFLHGVVGVYSLLWLLWQPLQKYSFKQAHEDSRVFDIPDGQNDFAFLLHMADQCNQLYSWRLANFLSAMHKNDMLDVVSSGKLSTKKKVSCHYPSLSSK